MSEIENLKIDGGSTYTVGNQDIVANEWEASKTYVKGKSYVIREHRLYVCNVTHTSVEPFDPDNWTEITVGEAIAANTTAIGSLSTLTTTVKSSIVGAVNEVNAKYKDYIYEGTNVAINTSYSSGAMYYANISLPDLDSDKLISVTLTDYGGLSNVLMFQITSKNSFRIWSKTSQTLTTLKARLFYVKSTT